MIVSLIVAMSENRVIGRDQKLPWHLPEDLKRFKRVTMGHPVIMGRKTYESIGRLLPGRTNVILTRNQSYRVEGAIMAPSLDEALARYQQSDEEVFVLGGGEIFAQALLKADRLYLTLVHENIAGDVYFPSFDESHFKKLSEKNHSGTPSFSFIDYVRSY